MTCSAAFEGMLQQAADARINTDFSSFVLGLFRRAMTGGLAEEKAAAVIKALGGSVT
jgi:hypothetical protein